MTLLQRLRLAIASRLPSLWVDYAHTVMVEPGETEYDAGFTEGVRACLHEFDRIVNESRNNGNHPD